MAAAVPGADRIMSMVAAPIEPDQSAAMVQAVVNPTELVKLNEESHYRILPNTFVFTKKVPVTTTAPRKRMRNEKERFAQVVGGAYQKKEPLYAFGVAYDGIPDAGAAKHWPNERGRLAIQVTGTCTIAISNEDLDQLQILDRLELDREKDPSTGIASVTDYNIPHLKKFDERKNEKRIELIKNIEHSLSPALTPLNPGVATGLLHGAGYRDLAYTDAGKKEIKDLMEKECRPLGVLLEKGYESARILLTPS